MIIKTLVENTAISQEYESEHGLSFYIETKKHKILFDMGKRDLFLKNARKMNVNIEDIDLAVISHGHYDHGGGLKTFLEQNKKAMVYIHSMAFEKHYVNRPNEGIVEIGLDEKLKNDSRIIFTKDYLRIDEELELFSNIKKKELCSHANKVLLMRKDGNLTEDSFMHEQNLIITETGKTVLLAGCAHNGIVNIIKHCIELKGKNPEYVIGGFHLFNPSTKQSENPELINQIAGFLIQAGSRYYTCHCTGLEAFSRLKAILGNHIGYLATGNVVEL